MGEIAAVGEFERAHSADIAGFDNLHDGFCVGVIENGNHARGADLFHDGYFIKSCHISIFKWFLNMLQTVFRP